MGAIKNRKNKYSEIIKIQQKNKKIQDTARCMRWSIRQGDRKKENSSKY